MENTQIIENLVKSVEDLQDTVAGLATAEAPVEVQETKEELQAKFFDIAKSGEGFGTELVKDGEIKAAVFNVTDETSAGAGVVEQVSRNILTRMIEEYAITKLFGRETAQSTKYERRVQVGTGGARWEGENHALANGAHTGSPEFATIKMTHGKAIAKPVITQEALSDPFFNAESFLMNDTRKQLGRLVAEGLVNGAGENQPRGFMTYFDAIEGVKPVETRKVDHFPVLSASVTTDEELLAALQAMQYELKTGYVSGAKYVMSRNMFQRVSAVKDGLGRPMMQTSLTAGVAGRIYGFDIVVDAMLSDEKPVVFGRLDEAFKIVNIPTAMNFIRNPYKIDFCVEFTLATRIGTIVGDNEAVVALIPAVSRKTK